MVSIIQQSHCLSLPTKSECSAIAFSESSANGLPIFTYNIGGVQISLKMERMVICYHLVHPDKNFGKKISECLQSGELEKMSKTAVDVYNKRLNWTVWGCKI